MTHLVVELKAKFAGSLCVQVPGAGVLHVRDGDGLGGGVCVRRRPARASHGEEAQQRRVA